MSNKPRHLNFTRRVVASYLLFGLAAVLCLIVGLPLLVRALVTSQTDVACINRLGRVNTAVLSAYSRHGEAALQPTVEKLRADGALLYCAVIDKNGRYLAHSTREQIGQVAPSHEIANQHWGEVICARYVDADQLAVREYRSPLVRQDEPVGEVCIAVLDNGIQSAIHAAAEFVPLAIIAPAVVIAAGAMRLQRLARPLAEVERQLRQAATTRDGHSLKFDAIRAGGALANGWNKLLTTRKEAPADNSLENRLHQVLDGFRNRKAEQILNGLPDGVGVTDAEGKITFANPALRALIGWKDHAIEGRQMSECLGLDATRKADQSLLASDALLRDVVAELGRSGDMSQGVLRVARYPLRVADSGLSGGHIWALRDVTQQKLADQMRNQFVYSATHELRTPLANIKAYAETLGRMTDLDVEKQKEFCNIINNEATRLARFIDDLLSISRMQAGSLALDRQPTDFERLLNETIEHVRPQMDQKGITFERALPEKIPDLKIDKDKITVTLVNLLGNAAKYTPAGGRVGLSLEVGGNQVHVHVEDSGYGIAVEELNKIFDKFFRSSDPRVQEETGSGLGLSLAHEVVRLHGGRLTVHSELDKGSKFTMSLPVG
ncbi:MAG: cell wall metabolism sensor histidine kinase WalK [Pirellulales bacterium]|nr:cell wall metabolism sensor histidine kinase WalK [Pirellulales bacterium]